MPPVILLVVLYFLFVVFISGQAVQSNLIASFFESQIRFIINHLYLNIFLVFVLIFLFLVVNKKKSKNFFQFIIQIVSLSIFGSLISFLLLVLIAITHLNILSLMSNISPKVTGIEVNTSAVEDRLKQSGNSSPVVIYKEDGSILLKVLASTQAGNKSYYGGNLIPSIPNFLILPIRGLDADIVMAENTLVVGEINSPGFQKVSPVIGYLMVKEYFSGKNIKSYPRIVMMDNKEYLEFRVNDFNEKINIIDDLVAKIDENIKELKINVNEKSDQISENEKNLKIEKLEREREYSKCVNAGYYRSGVYQRINTKEYCQEQVSHWDDSIKRISDDIKELTGSMEENKKRITQNQEYLKFYVSQKLLTQEEVNYVSYENAAFSPPDLIKITQIKRNNPQALADYMVVLIHEYLHYTTFNENDKGLGSLFFEEGITEYFAREIVEDSLGIRTNLAYPVNVKIIEQITKRISDEDLTEIYFTKSQENLAKLLDRVYGEGFYRDYLITLETMHYSANDREILKLANEVMSRIGGNPLNEEDLTSSDNTFR